MMKYFKEYRVHKIIAIAFPVIERENVLRSLEGGYYWGLTSPGMMDSSGQVIEEITGTPLERAKRAVNFLKTCDHSGLFVLENIPELIQGESQELVAFLVDSACYLLNADSKYAVILDAHDIGLPSSLRSLIPSFPYPLPTIDEIFQLLPHRDSRLATACAGLTAEEIKTGLRMIGDGDNPESVLLGYKVSRLKALGLEFIPKPSIGEFGGLDRIKSGIERVGREFSPEARRQNIPYPKGWLLAGVPGTGKTFCSQICASILGFPLISIGADVVKAGGVTHLKRLLARVEATSPCVAFFDEFDKFFSASSRSGEDKQSKQILGVLLTWLQEKRTATFVIATLNRLDALPPELTRAGRFDRIFYVGFPQSVERKEIFQLHAGRFDARWKTDETCPLTHSEWMVLLAKTVNYTGAEIRAIVETAAREEFHRGGDLEISLDGLLTAQTEVTSLFSRDPERVLAMENQARYIATSASSPDTSSFSPPLTSYWGD